MAPDGWLACMLSPCGGDSEFGTGQGVGYFRSVDPEITCEFNFADSTYACNTDVENTNSSAPVDLSNGYGYNDAMGAQLLHCKGPPKKSEVFVTGRNPDSRTGFNLGFNVVDQGRAVAHSMTTQWRNGTSMNAQYMAIDLQVVPIEYVGWCAGAN